MVCIKCGKRLKKQQTICPYCGASQKKGNNDSVQISLSQLNTTEQRKKTRSKKRLVVRIAIIIAAVVLALVVAGISIIFGLLGQVNRASDIEGSVGVNKDLPTSGVQNIALFGLDSRKNNDSGRSDAIIILSIDRNHNAIKMTSIARDTYVAIDGHGHDKMTHAWAYGKAALAVKTLNQNFNLNITDYAYINFYEFAQMIDYIGGVDIELNASELDILNNYYAPELNRLGITCPRVPGTGLQHLTGAQALAHSRNRYTGSDVDRGNRQKAVLEAAYQQVKDTPVTKYPGLISKILSMCHTNLSSTEMLSIATWAATKKPTFASLSLPTAACNAKHGADAMVNGVWYYIYDLDIATQLLHEFIYEADAAQFTRRPSTAYRTGATTTTTTLANPTGTTTTTEPDWTEPTDTEPTEPTDAEPTDPTDAEPTEPTDAEPTTPTTPTSPDDPGDE